MKKSRRLMLVFYLNLVIVGLLVSYKIYLNFFERDFSGVHAEQVERIQQKLAGKQAFSFAVVGNINNSVGVFERKIIPMLNAADIDFVVSAGNAVSGPGEDKYRALYRTLSRLTVPYLLTAGRNETKNFGSHRFYQHFGPYFFSFEAGGSRFIFLDSTAKASYAWQLRWLEELLATPASESTFVFIGHPLKQANRQSLLDENEDYLEQSDFRRALLVLISRYEVDAVFSANLHVYDHHHHENTHFITTGGAGGLVLNNDTSFYHFVKVEVANDAVNISLEPLDVGQHRLLETLESIWFFIHSLFYVGHLNFLLLLCLLISAAIYLYNLIFVDKNYYPNYGLDPSPYLNKDLRVAMFTNNYLPFIGGVPVSIERLRSGLTKKGIHVVLMAPRYQQHHGEEGVLRVPSLLSFGRKREFRIANIFLPRIARQLASFKPDIVHLHHPIWLGSAGLFWARRLGIATVYTYHTRLEHYAHFVPLPSALFRNLISHYLIKRFANKCDGVIVPTRSAGDYLRMIGVKSSIFVQASGIDYGRFCSVDEKDVEALRDKLGLKKERVLISVSRLSREKNIEFILKAVQDLRLRTDEPFKLVMVGEGNDRQHIEELIKHLDLANHVLLVGSVPPEEVSVYYSMSDVFLFASQSETQGLVVIEAMAAGLPVVAVRASGIEDFVIDDFNGFKTPGNIALWRSKVAQLLADNELRSQMGRNARIFARDYATETVTAKTVDIYANLLAARAAASQQA
jgi:1,2-diacylglycerol 3-alpha-glucosyltransferase